MRPSAARKNGWRWGISLALFLPVIVLYACEYLRGDGRSFTGFIQYDQAYYMANARKIFEGGFHFFYNNPYSADPNTPRIYFHFHLLFLGIMEHITGWDPGLLYVIFGFCSGLVCVRVAVALYEQVAGLETPLQKAGLVLFVWGGGVLALTGWGWHLLRGDDFRTTVLDLFHFDPAEGWWFLNFGRNLIFPTESYYHALFLGAMLLMMRKQFRGALWLAFALSFSHPFTGLQLLLILLAWCVIETGFLRNRSIPFLFPGILLCLLTFHLAYNVFLLNLFAEHRLVFAQWSRAWIEPATAVIPADLLVAFFAWRAMCTSERARELFAEPSNRLLLVWLVVSFALVHHDLLIAAKQPLHFSRGYVWIPLFLLGIRPLLRMVEAASRLENQLLRLGALTLIFLVGLSDNLAWMGLHMSMALAPRWQVAWLPQDGLSLGLTDRQLYRWLSQQPTPHKELLLTPDPKSQVVYLAMDYTDYRAWSSHYELTPLAGLRQLEINAYFQDGKVPADWQGRSFLVIWNKGSIKISNQLTAKPVFENSVYRVALIRFR
jgi:hypothetical protein